jgi:flagellar motility protein MotE (MotC chaperone)
MKNIVVLIVGSLVTFLTLLIVALALKSAKPEWFGGVAATPQQKSAALAKTVGTDSLRVAVAGDSTQSLAGTALQDSSHARVDSLLVVQLSSKAKVLESQVDSLKLQLQGTTAKVDTAAKQDWKSTAKLIESMSAEEACKILKEMNDTDVKQVLGKVKKRQAGKILAALDPSRAAKLLR